MEQNDALIGQEEEFENVSEEASQEDSEQEEKRAPVSMGDLLEEEGLELDFPKKGEVRTGIIATIGENEVLVSVGTKSEGVISGRELESIPKEERENFEIGQEIPVYVITPEDSNGNVVLSYVRAREEKDWEDVALMQKDEVVTESNIIGYNKGGLIVEVGHLRGFVPASQVSFLRRMSTSGDTPEQRWGNMVGEPIKVRIIEVDRERRRLILSERMALQETRESLKDRLLDEIEEGDIRKGRVTSLAEFGAFVNIEGADGLVHLSEISWDRIKHPNEVLEVGQEVEVKVISIDRERKRIGLSIRQMQEDPWVQKVSHLKDGMLVEGTITHLTKFGAFARLDGDLEGLIHVSELSEDRIAHPKEVVHEGDVVTLRVIKIDPERHRIGLSLRKVDSPAYADLDWKMALAQEVGKVHEEEEDETVSLVIESPDENEDVETQPEIEEAQVESITEDEVEVIEEDAVLEEVIVSEEKKEDEIEESNVEAENEEDKTETETDALVPEAEAENVEEE
jgi:small subunit ribosomal protein S1